MLLMMQSVEEQEIKKHAVTFRNVITLNTNKFCNLLDKLRIGYPLMITFFQLLQVNSYNYNSWGVGHTVILKYMTG